MARKTDPQDAQLAAAETRGIEMLDTAMRAAEAHYDQATGRVTIDLTNGCAYAFPAQLVQDLNGATDEQLADVEVDGLGFNLQRRNSKSVDFDPHLFCRVDRSNVTAFLGHPQCLRAISYRRRSSGFLNRK
jgi:hypothetical protein